MPYAIPAWNAVTGLLPHAGALPIISAMNPLALGVGTVVLLLLTEKTSMRWQPLLVMRVNELAIPMFLGFLVAGCPGMMVAVGISRLYHTHTIKASLVGFPILTAVKALNEWLSTYRTLPKQRQELGPSPSHQAITELRAKEAAAIQSLQQLLNNQKDPAARLQIAFLLGDLIPQETSPYTKPAHSVILSTIFKTLFVIPVEDIQFEGDDVTKFLHLIPNFIPRSLYTGQPPRPEDLLRFFFLLMRFEAHCPNSRDSFAAIAGCAVEQLQPLKTSTSVDQLIQLSYICRSEVNKRYQWVNEYVRIRQKLLEALAPMETIATTANDRLKIAQAYDLLDAYDARRRVLASGIQEGWLNPSAHTPRTSLEDLAVLVGAGYLNFTDPRDPSSSLIGEEERTQRRSQVDDWLKNTKAAEMDKNNTQRFEGILRFLQQLDLEYQKIDESNGYRNLGDIIGAISSNQSQPTLDELLSIYTLCHLQASRRSDIYTQEVSKDRIAPKTRMYNFDYIHTEVATQKKIQEKLDHELAKQGKPNQATEMATSILKTTGVLNPRTFADHPLDLDVFAPNIIKRYDAVAQAEATQYRKDACMTISGIAWTCLHIGFSLVA